MEWIQGLDLLLVLRLAVAAVGGFATGVVGGMVGLALGRPRLLLVYWVASNESRSIPASCSPMVA